MVPQRIQFRLTVEFDHRLIPTNLPSRFRHRRPCRRLKSVKARRNRGNLVPDYPAAAYNQTMILESFPVGPLQANCTLLGDPESGEAIVIDPGDEAERIHGRLTELGLKLKQILLTHAHIDHVGGALKLKQLTGAPIFLNEDDWSLLKTMKMQASWIGIPAPETAPPDEGLADGQIVGLERYPAQVIHTPGHTQGSICLYFAPLKLLVVGDTLFEGSIGRTDLPGGNFDQIIESIHTRLLPLASETRVLTGHGSETTIGAERSSNPFLRGQ